MDGTHAIGGNQTVDGDQLSTKLKNIKQELEKLGPAPPTTLDGQRVYLATIANDFSARVHHALSSSYNQATDSHTLFDKVEDLRLSTRVSQANQAYAKTMSKAGHAIEFQGHPDHGSEARSNIPVQPEHSNSDTSDEEDSDISVDTTEERNGLYYGGLPFEIPSDEALELGDVTAHRYQYTMPSTKPIIAEIEKLRAKYDGPRELGMIDQRIVTLVFCILAAKWEAMTLAHVSNVIHIVHHFIHVLLDETCGDELVRKNLWSLIAGEIQQQYKRAQDHAHLLLHVELKGKAATYNSAFNVMLGKYEKERMADKAEKFAIDIKGDAGRPGKYVHVDDVHKIKGACGSKGEAERIHDVVRSYYKIALDRFIDNICIQVVDHYLLNASNSPVNVFGPLRLSLMSDQEIGTIFVGEHAAERARLQNEKAQLESQLLALRGGQAI